MNLPLRLRGLASHIPPGQFGRYLLVGLWNTFFGYGLYAALTAILTPRVPYAYMLASALSSILNITVAFLGYKWFVFKTKDNYLREWCRCVAVYGSSTLLNLLLLPPVVWGLRRAGMDRGAPYAAGALLMGFGIVYGFLGHKKFTFRTAESWAVVAKSRAAKES